MLMLSLRQINHSVKGWESGQDNALMVLIVLQETFHHIWWLSHFPSESVIFVVVHISADAYTK